jgi:hypothetical protein
MAKRFPEHPKHPERICWGCDRYCAADAMQCGNGTDRTQHPEELFGADWSKLYQAEQPTAHTPDKKDTCTR